MLDRLSWKRLVFELILCCMVFTGGRDGIARLAFLEFTASFLVAVGRQKYDTPAGKRELGTATLRPAPDADA